jgi:hypothetical protein
MVKKLFQRFSIIQQLETYLPANDGTSGTTRAPRSYPQEWRPPSQCPTKCCTYFGKSITAIANSSTTESLISWVLTIRIFFITDNTRIRTNSAPNGETRGNCLDVSVILNLKRQNRRTSQMIRRLWKTCALIWISTTRTDRGRGRTWYMSGGVINSGESLTFHNHHELFKAVSIVTNGRDFRMIPTPSLSFRRVYIILYSFWVHFI